MRSTFLVGIWILFLFCIASETCAQRHVDRQDLLWMRYQLKAILNDKLQLNQELEERTFFNPWRQHQFVARTQLDRKLQNGWIASIGMVYSRQSLPQDPHISRYSNQNELRPQIDLSYRQNISSKFSMDHRYRTEFRYFEKANGSFNYGNNRTRYKIELRYAANEKLMMRAFDEILINVGGQIVQNVFDQNRYGASIQYMPKTNLGFELGYLNWFQQRKTGIDFYQRDIIRLTLHQNLNRKVQ